MSLQPFIFTVGLSQSGTFWSLVKTYPYNYNFSECSEGALSRLTWLSIWLVISALPVQCS